MVYEVPVPRLEPPLDAAYQFNVPALAVAPNINVPASHRELGVVLDTFGVVLTVATTAVRVEVQPALVAST